MCALYVLINQRVPSVTLQGSSECDCVCVFTLINFHKSAKEKQVDYHKSKAALKGINLLEKHFPESKRKYVTVYYDYIYTSKDKNMHAELAERVY